MSVRVEVVFSRTWGLWRVLARDADGARIYVETPDEAKARKRAEEIEAQKPATLDDIVPTWDGLGPEE